jgi:hypothetical protein
MDALQEFRVQTSTYAPEFGRMPGGQVSMVTRSGTNTFTGSVFDHFRDDAIDATDWFVNNPGVEKPALRQHNFDGVIGGPIFRGGTFYFGSYESLRLMQPRARTYRCQARRPVYHGRRCNSIWMHFHFPTEGMLDDQTTLASTSIGRCSLDWGYFPRSRNVR